MQIRDRIVELRRVRAGDLIPNSKNWRTHPDAQKTALRDLLTEVGYADALLVRETADGLQLIDGHLRASTTPDMEVPVLVLDVDEAEADKILATLDPLAALAIPDEAALAGLIDGVTTDSDAIRELMASAKGSKSGGSDWGDREDSVPDLTDDPICKPGDLWLLGPHRLLCGDSTNPTNVAKLMDGKKAKLFATDPPYLVDYTGSDRPSHGKDWSSVYKENEITDPEGFFTKAFSCAITACVDDAAWYCWHAYKRAHLIETIWESLGVLNHQQIIWCLSGGVRVYARVQRGVMPMRIIDLVKLAPETVQLWNGTGWTQVLGWSQTDSHDGLELVLRSGETINCTRHHCWPTARGKLRADQLQVGDVLASSRLPALQPAAAPAMLPDEPIGWMVGLYLAEGTLHRDLGFAIACHTGEVALWTKTLRGIVDDYAGTITARSAGNVGIIDIRSRALNAIIRTYITAGDQTVRHLTNACWQRDDTFLRALLDGYLEGDGHWDDTNSRWRLGFARNEALASDLRTLAARLDVGLRLTRATVQLAEKTHPIFRGQIRMHRSGHHNQKHDTEIIWIRASKTSSFWHIGVQDQPHLFALASGVLTGNSKPTFVHGYSFYPWKHEPCLMGWRKGHKPKHDGKNSEGISSVWEVDWEGKARVVGNEHPTQKPVELFAIPMRRHTKPGDIVYEPFSGSGSQIIAAEKEGRVCYAMEIEPRFVDVAVKRWETLTGQTAECIAAEAG